MNNNKQLRNEQAELDITISLETKLIEKAINKTLENFKKNMTIKGFRKGAAPLERVRANVKQNDLLAHSLDSLLKEGVKVAATFIKPEDGIIEGPTYRLVKYTPTEFEVTFTYPTRPVVEFKDFKGLNLEFKKPEVKLDELVENEIKAFSQRLAKWEKVDSAAVAGDKVKVDLKSDIIKYNVAEQAFKDYEIIIGKGVLLKEFEDQIIGMKVGETRQIKILLPMTHTIEVIRGKEVIYDLTLKSVERFTHPTITDELVKSLKIENVSTVAEFKKYLEEFVSKRELVNAQNKFIQQVINELKKDAKVSMSQIIVNNEALRTLQGLKKRMEQQKGNFAKWLHDTKMDEARLLEMYKVQAHNRIVEAAILAQIAKAQGITNTQEELDAKLAELAKEQRINLEIAKKIYAKENVELALTNHKLVELITKHFTK